MLSDYTRRNNQRPLQIQEFDRIIWQMPLLQNSLQTPSMSGHPMWLRAQLIFNPSNLFLKNGRHFVGGIFKCIINSIYPSNRRQVSRPYDSQTSISVTRIHSYQYGCSVSKLWNCNKIETMSHKIKRMQIKRLAYKPFIEPLMTKIAVIFHHWATIIAAYMQGSVCVCAQPMRHDVTL